MSGRRGVRLATHDPGVEYLFAETPVCERVAMADIVDGGARK
jgi:hypothetical protein